jgi:4-amino-4-deoxy-L-arabinose transferase-like glycosyltransferase
MTVVDVSPGSSRPYVGGSSDNTVWDLVVGYNGIGRVDGGTMGAGPGRGPGGAGPGTAMSAAGGVFGGTAGPFRLVSDAVGGQIAWLLPLALVGLVAAAWLHRRDRRRRAAVVLWSGWLLLYGVVFSSATGIFHSYYTSLLTPAIAAAVGIGGAALLTLARRSRGWFATALAGAVVTIGLQLELSGRVHDFYGWTRAVLIVLALGATTAVVIGIARRRGRTVAFALTAGLSALLLTPAAWALSETANPVLNSTLPQAGPRAGAAATTFGSAASNGDPALARFLLDRRRGERWDLVVSSAQSASGLIADEGLSVMALGGFMGNDPSTSPAAFADRVAAGEVRFVLVSGGMFGGGAGILPGGARLGAGGARGPGGSGFGGGSTASTIMGRVEQACSAVTADALPARYAGSLYDCRGAAGALRAPS